MSKKKLPQKWVDVYPQGSKAGDEEQAFFISIARHPKWTFRSSDQIAKETGLSKERVEELIQKYFKKGMVFQNPSNEDMWGYWERNTDLLPEEEESLTKSDHDERIEKASFSGILSSWSDDLSDE